MSPTVPLSSFTSTFPLLFFFVLSLLLLLPSPAFGSSSPLHLLDLFLLKPSSLSFSPPFTPTTLSYSLSSPTLLSTLSLQPSTSPSNSVQLRVNDGPFFTLTATEAEDVDLLEGINHLFLQVVHEDDASRATLTYLITVCNGVDCHQQVDAATPSAQLLSLVLPQVNLTPSFSSTVFAYTALSHRHTHGVVVVPTLLQSSPGVLIVASMNGDTFTSIASTRRSPPIPMKMGTNVLFVQVRDAQSQLCTYTVHIDRTGAGEAKKKRDAVDMNDEIEYIGGFAYIRIREASADLMSLVVSVGQLSPRFSPSVHQYHMTVDHHVPTLQVTAKLKDKEGKLVVFYTHSTSSSPAPATFALIPDTASDVIPLCVGVTSIKVQVTSYDGEVSDFYILTITRASEADENEGGTAELLPSAVSSTKYPAVPHRVKPSPSKHADPTLLGLRGQSYDVHVETGQVYCLVSEPHLLINARFVNMAVLNSDGSTNADRDPIIGIGEVAILTRTGHQLHIETGTGEAGVRGFSRVSLNEQPMNVEDQAFIENTAEGEHEGIYATTPTSLTELLAFNSSNTFTIITPNWHIVLLDTREGIVPRATLSAPLDLGAHGLLGQTWRDKKEGRLHSHDLEREVGRGGVGLSTEGTEDSMEVLEGSMEDYRIKDGSLFSAKFEFNLYEPEGGELTPQERR